MKNKMFKKQIFFFTSCYIDYNLEKTFENTKKCIDDKINDKKGKYGLISEAFNKYDFEEAKINI